MGTSYVSNKPVFSTFVSKLPATLLLTAVSILLTVLISIPLGIWSAVKQNTATDYVIRTASFIGNSLPNFFVSLLLMYFLRSGSAGFRSSPAASACRAWRCPP